MYTLTDQQAAILTTSKRSYSKVYTNANMQTHILKSVVSRTKIADLRAVLERWGWLEQEVEQVNVKQTKREIAINLVDICDVCH